eukprot:gene21097-26722_t
MHVPGLDSGISFFGAATKSFLFLCFGFWAIFNGVSLGEGDILIYSSCFPVNAARAAKCVRAAKSTFHRVQAASCKIGTLKRSLKTVDTDRRNFADFVKIVISSLPPLTNIMLRCLAIAVAGILAASASLAVVASIDPDGGLSFSEITFAAPAHLQSPPGHCNDCNTLITEAHISADSGSLPNAALLIADLPPGAVYAAAAAMFGAKVNANLTPHTAATDFFQAMSGYANLHATVRVAPTAAALKRLLDCEEAARNNGAAALLDPVSRTYAGLVAASVVFISPTGDVVFAGGSESYGQAEDRYAFSNSNHGRYNREVAYNASVLGRESCAELYNSLGSEPCYWLKLCFLHGNSWHLHTGTYGGFNLVFANGTIQCMITVDVPNHTSNGEHTLASHLRAGGFPEVVGARTLEELTKDGWKIGLLTGSGGMPLDSTATANVIGALTMRLNDDLKHERRTTIHFKRLWPALHPGGGL